MTKLFKKQPELILIPVFCIIYCFALTFQYVEGDDAYSIMYHALGRNREIERSYGAYQAMMDVCLSILPANETIVRIVAISIHALFGFLFPVLVVKLLRSYRLVNSDQYRTLLIFCLLIPFAFPELVFFGLYYQCSTIALSLILIAHLIFRNSFKGNGPGRAFRIASAIIIFSIGTCFRWDTGFYLLVILADILLITTGKLERSRIGWKTILPVALVGLLCVAGTLLCIMLEGYSIREIFGVFNYSQQERLAVVSERSWKVNLGSSLSLFTPFFLVTFLAGIVSVIRQRKYFLLVLLGLSYLHVWKFYNAEFLNPRRIINSIPFIIIICYLGFQYLWHMTAYRKYVIPLITIICFIPWVIGIKIYSDDTMWGPGFELKQQATLKKLGDDELQQVDERVGISNIAFTFFEGGFAVPFDGPRPIWGYYGVLFGGEWRRLLRGMNSERNDILARAQKDHIPVLQQDYDVKAMINLVREGYTTNDKLTGIKLDDELSTRRFFKGADTVVFLFPNNNAHLLVADMNYIKQCSEKVHSDSLYLYIYSTSILHNLKSLHPENVRTFGPATGVVVTRND